MGWWWLAQTNNRVLLIRTPRRGGDAGDRRLLTGDAGDAPSTERAKEEKCACKGRATPTRLTFLFVRTGERTAATLSGGRWLLSQSGID